MIVIVDYGMGNLHSVSKAVEAVGGKAIVSEEPDDIANAERIILPGVGAFGQAMQCLQEKNLARALTKAVIEEKKPFLGICLGMQLLAKDSDEWGMHQGLGWLEGHVRRFELLELKVPHVGWNNVSFVKHALVEGIPDKTDFYFVHSYRMLCPPEFTAGTCEYGDVFVAAVYKDNIFATQFHPEKSQKYGLRILKNFIKWDPKC